MAGTASTSTPVTVFNADGSQDITVVLHVPAPALVVAPPVTLPPVVTAPAGGVTSALTLVTDGVLGAMNGFVPPIIAWQDVSALPVNTALDTAWKKEYTIPSGDGIHIDNTIPYVVGNFPVASMQKIAKWDASEGVDDVPYPLSLTTPTTYYEGGGAITTKPKGDRHLLIYNRADSKLYELYQPRIISGVTQAYAGRVWDLTKPVVQTPGRNSCDAAGLPIAPLLLNYSEVAAGVINHPLRFTMNSTNKMYIPPACHSAGGDDSAYLGMIIRLKASVDITKFSKANQVILTCLRKFGGICADNGANMYFSATPDPRWNTDDLALLHALTENDFEIVNTGNPVMPPA